MSDVFISHSSADAKLAENIYVALGQRGIKCWMAPHDIVGGSDWASSINTAISESPVFLLIYSGNSANSTQVPREITLAANKGAVIIPYLAEECELSGAFEYYLASCHWVKADLSKNDLKIDELAQAIRGALNKDQALPAAVPTVHENIMVAAPPAKKKPIVPLAIIATAVLVCIIVAAVFLLSGKDDEAEGGSNESVSMSETAEQTENTTTAAESVESQPADNRTDIASEGIKEWYNAAIEVCSRDDYNAFKKLCTEDTPSENVQTQFDNISYVCGADAEIQYDFTVNVCVEDGTAWTVGMIYANNIGGDPESVRYMTLEAYFEPDVDGNYLYTSIPDSSIKDLRKEFLSERCGDYYTKEEGYVASCYWTFYEKAILSGVNMKVQKAIQNEDGSVTVVFGISNGYDHEITDIWLCSSSGSTTIYCSDSTGEKIKLDEFYETAVEYEHSMPEKIGPHEFRVLKFTIGKDELPEGFDLSEHTNVTTDFYYTFRNDKGELIQYPAVDTNAEAKVADNVEEWMHSAAKCAVNKDYEGFIKLFSGYSEEDLRWYYDKFTSFYADPAKGTAKTRFVYNVAAVYLDYAVVDLMLFANDYDGDKDDSYSFIFYFNRNSDAGFREVEDVPYPTKLLWRESYLDHLGEEYYYKGCYSSDYWLFYEKTVLSGVNIDLQKAKLNDDGSLTMVLGIANGTEWDITGITLSASGSNSMLYYQTVSGEYVVVYEGGVTPVKLIRPIPNVVKAGEFVTCELLVDSSALPAGFDVEKLKATDYSSAYMWNWK